MPPSLSGVNTGKIEDSPEAVYNRAAREILENENLITSREILDKYIGGFASGIEQAFKLQGMEVSLNLITTAIRDNIKTELINRLKSEIAQARETLQEKAKELFGRLALLGLTDLTFGDFLKAHNLN